MALINYLLLLGWSLDDKTETFSREEMIRHFSLDARQQVGRQLRPAEAARVPGAPDAVSAIAETVTMVLPFLGRVGLVSVPPTDAESHRTAEVSQRPGTGSRSPGTF